MHRRYRWILFTMISLYLVACASQPNTEKPATKQTDNQLTLCKEPRPQVCTREYRPVCATLKADTPCDKDDCGTEHKKTYATGCTACANPSVLSYSSGKCEN